MTYLLTIFFPVTMAVSCFVLRKQTRLVTLGAVVTMLVQIALVARLPVDPGAHGFVPGRSTVTNAAPHAGRAVVVNLDLADFFPSVTFPRVRSVFHRAGYSPAAATALALLSTECPLRPV